MVMKCTYASLYFMCYVSQPVFITLVDLKGLLWCTGMCSHVLWSRHTHNMSVVCLKCVCTYLHSYVGLHKMCACLHTTCVVTKVCLCVWCVVCVVCVWVCVWCVHVCGVCMCVVWCVWCVVWCVCGVCVWCVTGSTFLTCNQMTISTVLKIPDKIVGNMEQKFQLVVCNVW